MKVFILSLFFITVQLPNSIGETEFLSLVNNVKFYLTEFESQLELNEKLVLDYEFFLGEKEFQAPLYRAVKGKDYKIYIGMPIGFDFNSYEDFKKKLIPDSFKTISGDSEKFSFMKYKNKFGNGITEFIILKNKVKFLVLIIEDKFKKESKKFSLEECQERFN